MLKRYGVDTQTAHRDGIFFVDYSDFGNVFSYYVIGHYIPNYQISWYDQEDDDGTTKYFFFTLDEKQAG